MRWSEAILLVPLVIYAIAAGLYFRQGQHGLGITYVAYSIANIGLIIAARS